jgi:uncharacterized protein YegL
MPVARSDRTVKLAAFAALAVASALAAHARSSEPPAPPDRPPTPVAQAAPPRIEVAFVLDTTGSMSGLIEGAKSKIWSIANQLASGQPRPEIRMALVGYRDRGDAYVTRIHDLTDDVDAVYANLQAFSAGGGGDTPESVNQALHEAVTRLAWTPSQDVYKVVFLVGDAPPHADYAEDVPWSESVRLARERGIVVNTVQCGALDATASVWRAIASAGAGEYAAIRQDGGMLALATPMDQDLARLNRELADTVVPWGGVAEREEIESKRLRALEAPAPAAASRLGYMAKTGGRANTGRADLVDAVKEGKADAARVDPELLPAPLRAMAPEERASYVKDKLARREALKTQVAQKSSERDAWVRAEQARRAAAGEGDGFDAKVLETVRSQAAAKGIAY